VQDLLRHTSGLVYGMFGNSLVHQEYNKANLFDIQMKCGDVVIAAGLSYAPLTYYARSAGVPVCVAIVAFPPDVRQHPGWLDMTPTALSVLRQESEEMVASLTNAGALWVFVAEKGTGAEAGTALRAALSRTTRRPDESIELPGSFFDEVTVFRTTWRGPARP